MIIMAIDYGDVRTGVAVCDKFEMLASPVCVITQRDSEKLIGILEIVGFTISEYGFVMALVCAAIIAAVTFIICMGGLVIGKKFGTKLSNKASILGGVILIIIGIEIFVTGV